MKKQNSTYCNQSEIKPLTLEDLKKIAYKTVVGSTGTGKKKNWFELFMNRFGWYRSSEWYILRTDQLNSFQFSQKNPIDLTKENNSKN